ncbi:MAG: hypothetical protein DRQ88_02905 [Epsilonproteobacteria bacterium]|nr:MAG: hypothetical protein DRQ89_01860 [Campylobacterota bacterium]RLA67422.1 MAG: hypothetical protein DRQ88_02905 [Campylobacterota bacterium]
MQASSDIIGNIEFHNDPMLARAYWSGSRISSGQTLRIKNGTQIIIDKVYETAELEKSNILYQTKTFILVQSNAYPSIALRPIG